MKQHLLLLFILISLSVQAQTTTSNIIGRVKSSKEYLPEASIQAIHQPSGTHYGTATNPDGRYTLQGMRPGGPYEISISFVGYRTEIIKDIQLRLGENLLLNIELKNESQKLDEAVVKTTIGNNTTKTGAATYFSPSQLNSLPTIKRSITDIARLTPQANVNSNEAISFAGTNNRYNSFQIDGAMNNDVFGLTTNGMNGGQATVEPVSLETIEQIQVNIAPFDVRQSGFTGGGINAVTKSGTNRFQGSAYIFGNNQGLTGKTPGELKTGEKRERLIKQHDYQFGATLGGAIIRNKLFFYANYERTDKSYPTEYDLGKGSAITQESIDQITNYLKTKTDNTYHPDFSGKDVFTRSNKVGLKLDWNINERNKLTARYSYIDAEKLNFPRTKYTLSASDNGFTFNNTTHSWIAELNSHIKNSMNNELRASYVRVRDQRTPQGDPFPNITVKNVDGKNTVNLGTEYSSVANSIDQDIISLTDNFNWLVGSHSITFGTHNELYFFKNLFIQNLYGSYEFNSINDLINDKVNQYFYGQSKIDITGRPDYAPKFGALQIGVYAQDSWNISPHFNLTYGIRMDIPLLLDRPTENTEFNNSDIAQEYNVKTNAKLKATPLWSPRVGFRWYPDQEHSHLVRGGVGIFTGRIPFVWISNSFSNTGMEFIKYRQTSGINLNTNPYTQYEMLQDATPIKTTEVDVFAKDFKFSQNIRFNLAYEYSFPFGLKTTLEGLYSKTLNDIVYQDLNIEATDATVASTYGQDFDDRTIYKNRVNPKYTNVMYLGNTSKGYTYNLSLKLEKSFSFGLDASAAYSYGQSKSINSGSSSVAYTNWRYNETVGNANHPELTFSDYNIPHRIIASITYSKAYAKHFRTAISLIYTGQSGAPYNYTYYGDLNGDGSDGNDLLFIPTDAQIDKMPFYATTGKSVEEQRADLKAFLGSTKHLKDQRGEYYKRNAHNLDFEHHFDLRILQDFNLKAGNRTHTFQLSFDVMNIGNMFNKEWGLENYLANNTESLINIYKNKDNKYYQYTKGANYKPVSISNLASRWRGQIGIRYFF
ncbi:MAG: carboxypeptidase regulatory-like domain-containing protein [Odoribacter sp.]